VTPRELARSGRFARAAARRRACGAPTGHAAPSRPWWHGGTLAPRWRSRCSTLGGRASLQLGDEATIASGVDRELDELRTLRDGGKDAIARIQAEERARTGIASLKVGYNKVFGYFIEISNANRHLVPADYQRRQTLTGGERYVTPALKEYEEKILTAAERIEARERELFESLRGAIGQEIGRIQCAARILAELDVLAALADVAAREGYARPTITERLRSADRGRAPSRRGADDAARQVHPERRTAHRRCTAGDSHGSEHGGQEHAPPAGRTDRGAGASGKLRPGVAATIGVCDRVFTRVGASDNLVRGQSTFMVEMAETSAILHSATRHSLVLLDEIGRGTSTYDGVSIAWAVSEHLHNVVGCKTIFATHYHELVQLADELDAVRNYNVGVREVGDQCSSSIDCSRAAPTDRTGSRSESWRDFPRP
jgi:DNA mismatch repair protein MutS